MFIAFMTSNVSAVIASKDGSGSDDLGGAGEIGSMEKMDAIGLGSAVMVAQTEPAGKKMGLSLQLESRIGVFPPWKLM